VFVFGCEGGTGDLERRKGGTVIWDWGMERRKRGTVNWAGVGGRGEGRRKGGTVIWLKLILSESPAASVKRSRRGVADVPSSTTSRCMRRRHAAFHGGMLALLGPAPLCEADPGNRAEEEPPYGYADDIAPGFCADITPSTYES
jgi:hypothetical protein